MKLERLKPEVGIEMAVQVNSSDIQKRCEAQKLRSLKKNFIPSRFTGYHTGSLFNKYASAPHSKTRNYQQMLSNSGKTESAPALRGKNGTVRVENLKKGPRKALANSRNEEIQGPSQKYNEQQEESVETILICSSGSSGEESSPIETGYESHSSDSSRSRLAFSESPNTCPESPFNSELCESELNISLNAEDDLSNPNSAEIQQDEQLFRFYSATEETSQRDSGFMDMVNYCESPYSNGINSEDESTLDENSSNFKIQNGMSDEFSNNVDSNDPTLTNGNESETDEFKEVEYELHEYSKLPLCHTWMETSNSSEKLPLTMMEHGQIVNQYQNIDEILEIGPYKSNGLQKDSALINNNQHQLHCSDYNRNTSNVKDVKDVSNLAHSDEFDNDIRFRNNIGPVDQIKGTSKLDDCTLQLYRYNSGGEGDYGSYLDLESTVDEQVEEFDGFHNNRKNAVILRTQLSVRVHAIIEKLVNSSGRELRRALFSLKQIFQDDKDLVHEFVQNDGLACLIKVGSEADQNYQNYILRALGQVMLYVDGMNGVIEHNETIQWLYSLIASKFRLVVKTALKLLLVFVEYTETNSQLLINAVTVIDRENGSLPWSNIMNLLKEKDSADVELLVYASTLINKTLNGVPDQDTYYDVVDTLEEQGMEYVVQYYMSKQGTDLDLLQQFHIYEAVLKHEDDIPDTKPLPLDARLRQVPRSRKSYPDESDRRKSRRHSVGTVSSSKQNNFLNRSLEKTSEDSPFIWHDRYRKNDESRRRAQSQSNVMQLNENLENNMNDNEVGTMALSLKRRRERDARNKSFIKEQEENGKDVVYQKINNVLSNTNNICSENCEKSPLVIEETIQPATERRRSSVENCVEVENRKNGEFSQIKDDKFVDDGSKHFSKLSESIRPQSLTQARSDNNKKAWMFSMMYAKSQEEDVKSSQYERISPDDNVNNKYRPFNKTVEEERVRDNNLKDVREKFNGHHEGSQSPVSDNFARLGDSSGIISRAKEGLAASTSIRSEPKYSAAVESTSSKVSSETKKVDSDLQWEQLMHSLKRPLIINDLDFTDLKEEEDTSFLPAPDYGSDSSENCSESCTTPLPSRTGPPPPPPPLPTCGNSVPAPPQAPPPSRVFVLVNNPQLPPPWIRRNQHDSQNVLKDSKVSQKTKKTVKLFWREVKDDHSLLIKIGKKKTIWDELKPVTLDTQKLEHLFENRAKDIINKEKSQDCTKKSELIVLDTKRSNAINIGMTKLPPPRTIKTAILKMDSTIMNREGIEKLLTTMLPTEDEKSRIAEAQMANPDIPLGTAEQFLLTLSSISELDARLKLWAFRLDYDSIEKEVAEPLMDLKQAMKEIEDSETFRVILSTLRSVGNFLNGAAIKGFHIEYLSKVPEVKDTVQKHSLLHHLCHIVMEKFPKSTDLYSEIGSVTRASKVDYSEVARNLNKMESECKASWDYLKAIAKHDCSVTMKVRISEFLADCAERIIVLKVIHRRMINRYHKFLLYLGCINQSIEEMPVQKVCKILSEFALEFRTTRERVLQQIEKKANHRERNKTRGKMITDMAKFRTKEQQADHELKQLLGNTNGDTVKWGTFPSLRGRKSVSGQSRSLGYNNINSKDEGLTDGDDEILETLVKTATAQPARNEPKIRKKARYGDRKSLRRTLKNGLSDDEKFVLSSMTT